MCASLFSTSSLIRVTPTIWNMTQPQMTRELAGLKIDLKKQILTVAMPSTVSQETNPRCLMQPEKISYHPQKPLILLMIMRQLLLPICVHHWGTLGTDHFSDASQTSIRMWCYFYQLWDCFLNIFDDPVPDGTVIYTDNVLFQYNDQEGTYTEFLGNPTGNIFLATSRDHEFLLNHKGNMPNILNHSIEPTKPNFFWKILSISYK